VSFLAHEVYMKKSYHEELPSNLKCSIWI